VRAVRICFFLVILFSLCNSAAAAPVELLGIWNGTFSSDSGHEGTIANLTIRSDGSCQGKWLVYGGPVDLGASSGSYTFADGQIQFTLLGTATGFGSISQYKLTGSGSMEGLRISGDYSIVFYNLVWREYDYTSDTGVWQVSRDEFAEPEIRIEPTAIEAYCLEGSTQPQPISGAALKSSAGEVECEAVQSTTGPIPPPQVAPKVRKKLSLQDSEGSEKVLDVPAYRWRHGCGPTVIAMIIAYYDMHGYDDLFPGDARTQSEAINQAIASEGSEANPRHYEDYSLPDDSGEPEVLPDKSESPGGDEHTDDCIADYLKTSWSVLGNFYGWSWSIDLGPAFKAYVNSICPDYKPSYKSYRMSDGTLNWYVLTEQIDRGRPMVFVVDTNLDGLSDHFVTVVGYREAPSRQYGCFDMWYPHDVIRWADFKKIAQDQPWGVREAWSFRLAPLSSQSIVIHNDGRKPLSVTSILTQTPADWLDWAPEAPFEVPPHDYVEMNIIVDCGRAPCDQTTTRLLVYSNDPNDNPYPQGVHITVTKPNSSRDFNQDCRVDFKDLAVLARHWLGNEPAFDIAPAPGGDGIVNMLDFAVLSRNWPKEAR